MTLFRPRLHALLWLLAAGIATAQEVDTPQPAYLAPLAARSLLLDATVAGNRIVAVGERGHILVSEDNGANWRQVPAPVRATLTAVHFPDAGHGWIVGHDSTILATSDAGENWELQYRAPEQEQPLLDVWFRDTLNGIAVGAYGLYLETSDGGASWVARTVNEEEDRHLNSIAVDSSGRIFLAGESGSLYRSDDGGQNWTNLPRPYRGSFFGLLTLANDHLVTFGLRGHLFRSVDHGTSWQPVDSGTQATLLGGRVLADNRVLITGLGGTLLQGDAAGQVFTLTTRPNRAALSTVLEAPDGRLLLFTEHGIQSLQDAGNLK